MARQRKTLPPVPLKAARDSEESEELEEDPDADPSEDKEDEPADEPAASDPAVQPNAYAPAPRPPCEEDLARAYYEHVLGFNQDAAGALAYDQQLVHPSDFLELDEEDIDNICQAIRKPGGIGVGSQVAIISVTRLKLTLFYVKLNQRMSRPNPTFDKMTIDYLDLVKDQRKIEREYAMTKSGPDPKPLTLDLVTAPACFEKVKTYLSTLRGASGILLRYVIREAIYPLREGQSTWFGNWKHRHSTIDLELIDRAPILSDAHDTSLQSSVLEVKGPFSMAFTIDMVTVWNILFAMFGQCPCWQHVKKFAPTQNGRRAWRTLQTHFFGGDKATALYQACIQRLSTLRYDADRKNWNFEKYLMAHVKEHNALDTLHIEYGQQRMPEAMKVKYFQDGITDRTFDSVVLSIQANPKQFNDFETVKDQYLTFKRTQQRMEQTSVRSPPRSISEVGRSGPGRGRGGRDGRDGGRTGGRTGRGRGTRDERRQRGLPDQADVDRCTHIVNKFYPVEEMKKFTPAERQRLYQLRQAENERYKSSNVSEAGTKRPSDTDHDDEYDRTNDSKRNRDSDALTRSSPSGRQVAFKTEK